MYKFYVRSQSISWQDSRKFLPLTYHEFIKILPRNYCTLKGFQSWSRFYHDLIQILLCQSFVPNLAGILRGNYKILTKTYSVTVFESFTVCPRDVSKVCKDMSMWDIALKSIFTEVYNNSYKMKLNLPFQQTRPKKLFVSYPLAGWNKKWSQATSG